MLDEWALVRFLHVVGAITWLGGQLAISAMVLPVARRWLDATDRAAVMQALGIRFGKLTITALIPVQVVTGVALAWHKGVTIASLAEPGYGRTLAGKLVAFVLVMLAAGLHGWAKAAGPGRAGLARALAISSLIGSFVIVLLATALPES